jgi:hypothetical protein
MIFSPTNIKLGVQGDGSVVSLETTSDSHPTDPK